jgi:CMP-N-acetylneuraminic acid synthetase
MTIDCVALLLGRKGSKGLPGKNTMEVLGRPISHYSIMAAMNSKYVTDLYLSTDDEEIKNKVKEFDLQVIDRPKALCTDEALFEDALIHGYKEIIKRRNKKPDILVILMCNVVTIDNKLIDNAVDALLNDELADSAVSISILNMYSPLRARKLDENGYLQPFVPFETFGDPKTLSCDRDSQGDVFFADMSHSVSRSRALDDIDNGLLPQRWMGKKIIPVYNSYGCDIDLPWQVKASQWWLENNGFTEDITPYETS